jgi:hypothetical protein
MSKELNISDKSNDPPEVRNQEERLPSDSKDPEPNSGQGFSKDLEASKSENLLTSKQAEQELGSQKTKGTKARKQGKQKKDHRSS